MGTLVIKDDTYEIASTCMSLQQIRDCMVADVELKHDDGSFDGALEQWHMYGETGVDCTVSMNSLKEIHARFHPGGFSLGVNGVEFNGQLVIEKTGLS